MGNKRTILEKITLGKKKKSQRNPPKISPFKCLLEWPPNSVALMTLMHSG